MQTKFSNQNKLRIAVLFFGLILLTIAGCKKDETPGANEVFMQNTAFTPSAITVAVNATVKWTNKDGMTHNVTGTGFTSGDVAAGGTYSHQFTAAGTYPYSCTIHSGMNGTVVVQ